MDRCGLLAAAAWTFVLEVCGRLFGPDLLLDCFGVAAGSRAYVTRQARQQCICVRRQAIAAPGDVLIGPDERELAAVERTRFRNGDVEHGERNSARFRGAF